MATAFLAFAAAGCGTASDDTIDAARMNEQLARIVFQIKLAQGFDFPRIHVTCEGASSDGLHFTCHVAAKRPRWPLNEWDETVSCQPPGDTDTPRCTTNSGYALQ